MAKKLILVFLLVAGMLASCLVIAVIVILGLSSFRGTPLIGLPLPGSMPNTRHEERQEQTFTAAGPVQLNLTSVAGNVQVRADPAVGNQVQVTADKTTWGVNDEQAQEAMDKLVVTMQQDGSTITLKVEDQRSILPVNNRTSTVEFTIRVPVQTSVNLQTSFGTIDLSGIEGSASLDSRFGALTISDVQGDLKATTSHGAVAARRITASQSDIVLRSDFGAVTLTDASGQNITLSSRNGDVELTSVTAAGAVSLDSQFGRISYFQGTAESLKADTASGAVVLKELEVENLVQAVSRFGAITLNRVSAGSYDLSTSNGAVTLDSAQGQVKARSEFGDIEVQGENTTLDLVTRSGQVNFRGSLGDGPHTLKTEFGAVRLTLPRDSAFSFDLQTSFGKISSEFEVSINGTPDEKHWRGSVNGGGAAVQAFTSNGNITLGYSR
jgi:DUF4097 and DUF4098 domain-containing protein YvlB